jgi:hypothetical protein
LPSASLAFNSPITPKELAAKEDATATDEVLFRKSRLDNV